MVPLPCRNAANDVIDSNSPLVGAPAYMPVTESNYQFYFVTLSHGHSSHSRSTISSASSVVSGTDVRRCSLSDDELLLMINAESAGCLCRAARP